jgi:hypothetical protein
MSPSVSYAAMQVVGPLRHVGDWAMGTCGHGIMECDGLVGCGTAIGALSL